MVRGREIVLWWSIGRRLLLLLLLLLLTAWRIYIHSSGRCRVDMKFSSYAEGITRNRDRVVVGTQ